MALVSKISVYSKLVTGAVGQVEMFSVKISIESHKIKLARSICNWNDTANFRYNLFVILVRDLMSIGNRTDILNF